jgi:hypothetical protein
MIPTYFPEKFKKMIAHWDDERKSGNALIISLKDGWHHPHPRPMSLVWAPLKKPCQSCAIVSLASAEVAEPI